MRITRSFVAIVLLAGASVACGREGVPINRSDLGDAWPLTIEGGTLRCETDGPRQLVTLDTGDGIEYGINGSARQFGFPDVKAVLRPGKVLADLQPLIQKGLPLCR